MLKTIGCVALLNFKEAARDKLFAGVIFFSVFYLSFCVLLGKLSVGHTDKVLRDMGIAGIELTAMILIVISFTQKFYQERETRILQVYLSHFRRTDYILGKILGYVFISLFYLFLSGCGFVLVLILFQSFNGAAVIALYPVFLKVSILICFCAIFSCLFSSSTMAMMTSFFIYWASEIAPGALKIIGLHGSAWQKILFDAMYALLPNMDKLDMKLMAAQGITPPGGYFLTMTVYALLYISVLGMTAVFIFKRGEY